jgi:hypothetical protein
MDFLNLTKKTPSLRWIKPRHPHQSIHTWGYNNITNLPSDWLGSLANQNLCFSIYHWSRPMEESIRIGLFLSFLATFIFWCLWLCGLSFQTLRFLLWLWVLWTHFWCWAHLKVSYYNTFLHWLIEELHTNVYAEIYLCNKLVFINNNKWWIACNFSFGLSCCQNPINILIIRIIYKICITRMSIYPYTSITQ